MQEIPPFITDKHPPLPWEELLKIESFVAQGGEVAKAAISKLIASHPFASHTHHYHHTYWRVRPTKAPFKDIKDVLWPPLHAGKLCRANSAARPLLYVADRRDTALTEVVSAETASAHFLGVAIRPGKKPNIAPIGEMFHIYRTGKGISSTDEQAKIFENLLNACPNDDAQRLVIADGIIFKIFSECHDYEITSFLAEQLYEKLPNLDGFTYRSVKQYGALNLALKPDAYLKNWGISASFFAAHCQHQALGLWKIGSRLDAIDITHDNKFVFSEQPTEERSYLKFEPPIPAQGHPVLIE